MAVMYTISKLRKQLGDDGEAQELLYMAYQAASDAGLRDEMHSLTLELNASSSTMDTNVENNGRAKLIAKLLEQVTAYSNDESRSKDLARSLHLLAENYCSMENFDEALQHAYEARKLFMKLEDDRGTFHPESITRIQYY